MGRVLFGALLLATVGGIAGYLPAYTPPEPLHTMSILIGVGAGAIVGAIAAAVSAQPTAKPSPTWVPWACLALAVLAGAFVAMNRVRENANRLAPTSTGGRQPETQSEVVPVK
jgi:hypothetical protein